MPFNQLQCTSDKQPSSQPMDNRGHTIQIQTVEKHRTKACAITADNYSLLVHLWHGLLLKHKKVVSSVIGKHLQGALLWTQGCKRLQDFKMQERCIHRLLTYSSYKYWQCDQDDSRDEY